LAISTIIRTFAEVNQKYNNMARQLRKQSATGIHHVMLRGINRQIIFEAPEDYRMFIHYLYQVTKPTDEAGRALPAYATIYAYCLMTNHVHLLIREGAENLSYIVKRIAAAYARFYNDKYQHYGHLFQDRFKSEPVNDAAYFFTLLRYIHQNPVAGGLAKDVANYEWSSWGEYERRGVGNTVCAVRQVISRMPFEVLRDLVFELLPKSTMILDFDNASKVKTDNDIRDYLTTTYGLRDTTDIMLYSRERIKDMIHSAKGYGASIRQLSRLTGISVGIIRNM
jgi:REP element-mobilizing transposase RayT